jgi:hypothetical protein
VQLTFWHHLGGNFESIRNLAILLASIDIPNHSTVCIGIDVMPNFLVRFMINLLPFVDMGSFTKGVKLHRPFRLRTGEAASFPLSCLIANFELGVFWLIHWAE